MKMDYLQNSLSAMLLTDQSINNYTINSRRDGTLRSPFAVKLKGRWSFFEENIPPKQRSVSVCVIFP